MPSTVVAYVAAQLGIDDPSSLPPYTARPMTPYAHVWEIRRAYGYRAFGAAEPELGEFLAARAWTSNDGPHALFERATAWLVEHKALLPGATTLAKLVATMRTEAAERLWRLLADAGNLELRGRLERLLAIEAGTRFSALERLRTAPSRVSGPELVRALERVAEVRALAAVLIQLAVLAFLVLLRFKINSAWLVLAGALIGAGVHLVHGRSSPLFACSRDAGSWALSHSATPISRQTSATIPRGLRCSTTTSNAICPLLSVDGVHPTGIRDLGQSKVRNVGADGRIPRIVVGWMTVEAPIAVGLGVLARSVLLTAFAPR